MPLSGPHDDDPSAQDGPDSPVSDPAGTARSVVVLGAGLAGLSAAHRLATEGFRVTVLEASPHVGGLAASFTKQTPWGEFDYDNGPHRFHTGEEHLNEEVLRLLGDNVCTANRQSRIFLYKRFFHYPLQGANVIGLPKLVLLRAFWDYFAVKVRNVFSRRPDINFENWVINRFGRKLYEIFFGVYTEKTWGIPCTQISADWAAQRITLLSLWDTVMKTLFKPKNVPRTMVSKFFYPRRGGIGTLCRRYAEELRLGGHEVLTSSPVTGVETVDGRVVAVRYKSERGEDVRLPATEVIGTIPLNVLARLLDPPAPAAVEDACASLRHRSMIFVYLILDRPKVTDDHWIYLPEQSLITHRLSEFKNFSPDAAPPDKTLLCAEITCDYLDEDWKRTDEELEKIVVRDLTEGIGLINEREVLMTFSRRERYAYPIYDLEYRGHRDLIMSHVESIRGLDTTGRQGLFKYNNMDHSIGMGLAVARSLVDGGPDHKAVATEQKWFG
jgi:protoporphyrinogen oxidase